MTTARNHDSAVRKLARLGLPLLALSAVLLALGAVVFAQQRSSARASSSGHVVADLSALEDRLAAHRDKLDGLSAASREARLQAEQWAADHAAAADEREISTPATKPERRDTRDQERGHRASETDPTAEPGDRDAANPADDGRITLDCDVNSPLGCMDQ